MSTGSSLLERRVPVEFLWWPTPTVATMFGLSVLERQHGRNKDIMKKVNSKELEDDLRSEYDLSKLEGGVRGKYTRQFRKGTNLVLLSPDVARYFPNDNSVNAALRSLVQIAKEELRHA
jgi:uncharacterized protein YicC (UPF0701 family)